MYRKFICIISFLVALWSDGTVWAQQEGDKAEMSRNTGRKESKAWEIGLGGSLINWNRVSFSGFTANPDNYYHNLKVDHLLGGPSLYVAREICPWVYVDLQGMMGISEHNSDPRSGKKHSLLYMGGLGVQLRLTPLFESKYVEPYLRVGINYLHKNFASAYSGNFADDPTGLAHWEASDFWNPNGRKSDKDNMVPLSFGLGVNAWMSNRLGVGIQGEYLMPVQKDLPRFFAASVRLLLRFGGKDKRPAPVVRTIEVEKPVERIVEKVVEVPVESAASTSYNLCRLLDNVHFDFDRDQIATESESLLDEIVDVLKNNADSKWLITGYTDARGSRAYNIDLSKRRAKMVYDALLERGVPATSLKWRGVGKAAAAIPATGSDAVRRGDRKVLLERVDNEAYWQALD